MREATSDVRKAAEAARDAAQHVATLTTEQKNNYLRDLAGALVAAEEDIFRANAADIARAEEDGLSTPKLKRLGITSESLAQMAEGLRQVADLEDPVARVTRDQTLENGLRIKRVRCPLGVVMMIYESRPNVTIDAFSLCFKSGNACILKGGKEAQASNEAMAEVIHATLRAHGLPEEALVLVGTGGREAVAELLTFNDCIDLVIPRGGEMLIRYVSENSSIPTVQHFHGICHVYVDAEANLEQALEISVTGKTSAPATCNATEAVLVHEDVAETFLPDLVASYRQAGVEVRGDEAARAIDPDVTAAATDDWGKEFLDMIVAVKVVPDMDAAIDHIHHFGSDHTDTIVTENAETAAAFTQRVQSSCTLVNASTRFNDGFQLGMGAEIGISTSRVHAYGPMGLEELTSQRFVVEGAGHVR
jgi:glutamate-5-semialdehyde dehydrogenase